jgi:hypothetical protein
MKWEGREKSTNIEDRRTKADSIEELIEMLTAQEGGTPLPRPDPRNVAPTPMPYQDHNMRAIEDLLLNDEFMSNNDQGLVAPEIDDWLVDMINNIPMRDRKTELWMPKQGMGFNRGN